MNKKSLGHGVSVLCEVHGAAHRGLYRDLKSLGVYRLALCGNEKQKVLLYEGTTASTKSRVPWSFWQIKPVHHHVTFIPISELEEHMSNLVHLGQPELCIAL